MFQSRPICLLVQPRAMRHSNSNWRRNEFTPFTVALAARILVDLHVVAIAKSTFALFLVKLALVEQNGFVDPLRQPLPSFKTCTVWRVPSIMATALFPLSNITFQPRHRQSIARRKL